MHGMKPRVSYISVKCHKLLKIDNYNRIALHGKMCVSLTSVDKE